MAISEGVRPATPRPPAKKPQVSRRSFLRTAWLAGLGAAVAGFGAGTVYFLWPNLSSGFGSKIQAGTPGGNIMFLKYGTNPCRRMPM